MKFLRLLIKNMLRNKRRTFLTVSSIAVSLFLVATLLTVLVQLVDPPETPDSALRLIVRHRVSLFNTLPIAYREKIAQIEGVEAVVGSMWFGGYWKDPSQFFANFSVNPDGFFKVYPDLQLPEEQKEAFKNDRTGALVGANLAKQMGWELGDRITLISPLFNQIQPELTIRAIYQGGNDDDMTFYYHWDYFNEGLGRANFTGTYNVRAASKEDVPRVAEAIDAAFRNANPPTKTETERAFILGFIQMLGNIQYLISSICGVVVFTVILVAATTMAMAIRERGREIAVLKALGFRTRLILSLLLSESVLLAALAAFIGSMAAWAFFGATGVGAGFIPRLAVRPWIIGFCVFIGAMVGLLASGIPAWRAARISVVDAMRRIV
ncbi:MAG TPA: FtsX-like permease family protein [Acidobacteriota bacterium]|nr:FtsX-like permease family protein [Acidobacteriota bacterium]